LINVANSSKIPKKKRIYDQKRLFSLALAASFAFCAACALLVLEDAAVLFFLAEVLFAEAPELLAVFFFEAALVLFAAIFNASSFQIITV